MKPAILIDEAQEDVADAYDWYEDRQEGLGDQFLLALRETVERVRRLPTAYPMISGAVRRTLLPRFPYSLLYQDDPEQLVVIAVFHAKRAPFSWQGRNG